MKVLVVDDDADQLAVRCLLLERNGFQAIEAGDPSSARDAARREKPPCAVLDLRLPDEKTGVQLVCELKGINPELRIILFTGASAARVASYPELRLVNEVVPKSSGFSSVIEKLKGAAAADTGS